MLNLFIDGPWGFYVRITDLAKDKGLKDFEPCLFTVPCTFCDKQMIFTHKLENYDRVKEVLREAFRKMVSRRM